MADRAGQTSVPQIWIGEQHIGGCDQLYGLERSGSLDPLLAKSVARLDLIEKEAFMAEEERAAREAQQQQFVTQRIYTKDMSFESHDADVFGRNGNRSERRPQ